MIIRKKPPSHYLISRDEVEYFEFVYLYIITYQIFKKV